MEGRFVLFYYVILILFLIPQSVFAGPRDQILNVDSGYDPVIMPELHSTSVILDDDDIPPREPNVSKIKLLKTPPLTGIDERVDSLVHGIKQDVAPEFDHYGHEIRRYMARAGNNEIFGYTDYDGVSEGESAEREAYLIEQIKNVRKAAVIADFWKKHLEKEIKEIEAIIEGDEGVEFATRTVFKQNKVTTRTFIVSLKGWIDANERILMHVYQDPKLYEVYYPEVIIKSPNDRLDFYNLLVVRQTKLKEIRDYTPFAMMVY